MNIPFFNYQALFSEHEQELVDIFKDVGSRGAYILQKDLEDFERNLADFMNVKYAFGVANGTDALDIALRAAGIGAGDEVIVPSHTYIASAAAIHFSGATPVLAELGPDHMLDADHAETLMTDKTRAIMPVQVNGRTCNMDQIQEIAEKHTLKIIEDAAQGLGSKFKGKHAGTFGLAGTISFYPAKLLGCLGDGGAIVTNDDAMAEKMFLLRDHGRNEEGEVVAWGVNSRLDNLQAAFLDFKLKNYHHDIQRRREIAKLYQEGLGDLDQLALPPAPDEDGPHFDVYQNYELEADSRDELKDYLAEQGVRTIIQWAGTPVHQFQKLGFDVDLPKTDKFFTRCLMLPMNMSLTDDEVAYIIEKIRAFYQK